MSCFEGKMKEYPEVSLDRFDGLNLQSTGYFLSHCHADHLVGLNSPEFSVRLSQNPSIRLYCSEVTASLLLAIKRFEHLGPYIDKLQIDEEVLLSLPRLSDNDGPHERSLAVTLIPAGHCPGSVMFLIKGNEGAVLYTGDFRFQVGQTVRLTSLFSRTKGYTLRTSIKSVYVDTTFCVPEAFSIPTCQECLKLITETIQNWVSRTNKYLVHIFSRSSYGYEFLMNELASRFKCQIHVTEKQYQKYRFVPAILRVLTTDPNSTKIHFCQLGVISNVEEDLELCKQRSKFNRTELPCLKDLRHAPAILQIIPSVMFFARGDKVTPSQMSYCESETVLRLCYSSHSSYEEIIDFLRAIKPENIFPNVCPNAQLSLADIRAQLCYLETKPSTSSSMASSNFGPVKFNKNRKLAYMGYTDELGTQPTTPKLLCKDPKREQISQNETCQATSSCSELPCNDPKPEEIAEHEVYQPSTSKPKPKEAVNFKLKFEIPDSLELLDQLI